MASAERRSAAEIEREIEEERNALTRTLDEIHDRLSFEALTGEFVGRVRESGGDIGRGVVRGVRENPIPLALTAMGLVWLAANRRGTARDNDDPYEPVARRPTSGRPVAGRGTVLRDPEAVVDPAPLYDASGRPLQRDEARWDDAREEGGEAVHGLAEEASGRLSEASRAVRRGARSAYASAAELRRRIVHGTEGMSTEARKRVVAARVRAYEAQLSAEKYTARGRERAGELYDEQPLVAGALALAFGAAIGGLLPRTRREDAAFGTYRDRVFEEAERIFHEERARLDTTARETARDMGQVARDVASDIGGDLGRGVERAGEIARANLSEAGAAISRDASDGDAPDDARPKRQKA